MIRTINQILFIIIFLFSFGVALGQSSARTYLFVGSYTEGENAEGIYVYEFNSSTGTLKEVEREDNLINPSFLTLSNDGRFLYACTESQLEKNGSIASFRIDTLSGKISFINKQDAEGRNPVHLVVDKNDRYLINSNYTDAGISIFKINKNGALDSCSLLLEFKGGSVVPNRQDKAHIHSCNFSADNNFLFAPDLGHDRIRAFSYNQEGILEVQNKLDILTRPGSGPRHFTFHPNHRYAYCIEELSGTVTSYSYQNGQLKWIDSDFSYSKIRKSYASSDIHISPDGKFLYAANRLKGENTLSIFSISPGDGTLSLVAHQKTFGDHPRSFVIDPGGKFLIVANQNSGSIVVFKRNLISGLLTKVGSELSLKLPSSLKMKEYGNQLK